MPATRTVIHRAVATREYALATDTTNNQRRVRFAIEILPAENVMLGSGEVSYSALGSGCIREHSFGDGKFEGGVFIGATETEEHTVQLDYVALPSLLRDWISIDSGVTITVGAVTHWLSSVWIIRCDNGDGSLDVEDFPVHFIGVHYHQEGAEYTFTTSDGAVVMEVVLQHIGKAVLEAISIDRLRAVMLDDLSFLTGVTSKQRLYDAAYDNGLAGGSKATYAWGQQGATINTLQHSAWLLPLSNLYEAMLYEADAIFGRYMRAGVGSWATAIASWSDGKHLFQQSVIFREHLHTISRSEGADIAYLDCKFLALISNEPNPGVQTAASAAWIGGMLVDKGQSFHEQANAWNLLRVLSENGVNKTLISVSALTTNFQLHYEVLRLMDNAHGAESATVPIVPGDLLPSPKWKTAEYDVRSCDVEIPSAQGDDAATVTKTLGTNTAEKPHALTFAVHNQPTVGDVDNVTYINNSADFVGTSIIAITATGFNERCLYYDATPAIATGTIGMRMSGNCSVIYAKENTDEHRLTLSGSALTAWPAVPYVGLVVAGTQAYYDLLLRTPLAAALIEEQRTFNYAYAACATVLRIFGRNITNGNPYGTAVLRGVLVGRRPPSIVGRLFQLSDDSVVGFTEGGTRTTLWDRSPSQRLGVCTSAKADDVNGTTDVEIVFTADTFFYIPP